MQILSKQLRRFEINCFLQADAIAAISSNDADSVRRLAPDADVVPIPFAIGLQNGPIPQKSFCARFGHIGSMDWAPNLEGIDWFLNFVWPLVIKKCPQASFFLAGRNMPSRFVSNQSLNLFVEGEVESSSQFMLSLDALIVPLFSGSGVRIKIAEALSLGVPVITTPVGSEGLLVKNGRDIIISDNALQMTTDICRVIDNPDLLQNISENGLNTIRKHHSSETITQNLIALIERKMKS